MKKGRMEQAEIPQTSSPSINSPKKNDKGLVIMGVYCIVYSILYAVLVFFQENITLTALPSFNFEFY